jgi:diacylglycerol kinase
VVLTLLIVGISLAWGLSRLEWLVLVLTISLVLSMEAINTAVEAVVDLASPQFHPLAKLAKDVAAGGVLIAAIGAVVIALLLYGERLLRLARTLFG